MSPVEVEVHEQSCSIDAVGFFTGKWLCHRVQVSATKKPLHFYVELAKVWALLSARILLYKVLQIANKYARVSHLQWCFDVPKGCW